MGDITALVGSDFCYLFNLKIDKENQTIEDTSKIMLERFVRKLWINIETDPNFKSQPFEFYCLESVFKAAVAKQRFLVSSFRDKCAQVALGSTKSDLQRFEFSMIELKIGLTKALTDIEAIIHSFNELLSNDEDMASMYLTHKVWFYTHIFYTF